MRGKRYLPQQEVSLWGSLMLDIWVTLTWFVATPLAAWLYQISRLFCSALSQPRCFPAALPVTAQPAAIVPPQPMRGGDVSGCVFFVPEKVNEGAGLLTTQDSKVQRHSPSTGLVGCACVHNVRACVCRVMKVLACRGFTSFVLNHLDSLFRCEYYV